LPAKIVELRTLWRAWQASFEISNTEHHSEAASVGGLLHFPRPAPLRVPNCSLLLFKNVFALPVEPPARRCYPAGHENLRCHLSRVRRRLSPDRIGDEAGNERRVSVPGLRPGARAFRWLSRGCYPSYRPALKAQGQRGQAVFKLTSLRHKSVSRSYRTHVIDWWGPARAMTGERSRAAEISRSKSNDNNFFPRRFDRS
jgi:hypothetical protein